MIIYVCDRCGDREKDGDKMRTVALVDVVKSGRIGAVESDRMLCRSCISQVQATIAEQLPRPA